ncbi:MAG TPA: hypothetical protein VGE45_14560 [Chloroflexia bacterium]|jgi:hypothetical protein
MALKIRIDSVSAFHPAPKVRKHKKSMDVIPIDAIEAANPLVERVKKCRDIMRAKVDMAARVINHQYSPGRDSTGIESSLIFMDIYATTRMPRTPAASSSPYAHRGQLRSFSSIRHSLAALEIAPSTRTGLF